MGYDHRYVCSDSGSCAGLMPSGTFMQSLTYGPGTVLPETKENGDQCKKVDTDKKCDSNKYEACIQKKTTTFLTKDHYGLLVHNCRDWAQETIAECKAQSCK